MSLPPLAPIPPPTIRLSIAPPEWEACLKSWLTLSELYLRLPSKNFNTKSFPGRPLEGFLLSFYHERAHVKSEDKTFSNASAHKLQRACFLITRRMLLESNYAANRLRDFGFLADLCHVHGKSPTLSRLMSELWEQQAGVLENSMLQRKQAMVKLLELPPKEGTQRELRQLAAVMRTSPDAAVLFMTGSDFLDALILRCNKFNSPEERMLVVATSYLGLLSLIKTDSPNVSLLSDHLYSLKAQADQARDKLSLLPELITNTPLVAKLRRSVSGKAAERLLKLLDTLETYRSPSIAQPRKFFSHKPSKGKGRAVHVNGEMHVHRMSLVTQVQDLFPDLGSDFVLRLLDEYGDNVEQVTAHLLDDSLPKHLQDLHRTEQAAVFDHRQEAEVENLVPRSTPPPPQSFIPERRNVFDDDELERLDLGTARLHIGKKKEVQSNDQPNKAAILSALAAFDSDDDERDDTYDVEDVGGTVDTSHPDGEPSPSARVTQEENDTALFTAYKASPELFGRTFNVRRGQARQALKAETGMTDEAIEGWATMLQRDPRRLTRLEAQFGSFDGKQSDLAKSAYRDSAGGTETEDSDAPGGRGGFRGGSRGRGNRGRGRGNVAGPSNDPNTASAQRRKEASKSSRANHNRRDQRARKIARGGFAG